MKGFLPTFELIWKAYSGEAAWQAVADLSRHHRIQASPGFREAAHYVQRRLTEAGLAAEVLSYPADERTHFWAWRSFQEWDCTEATLRLVEPAEQAMVLADFRACPISIIQRSTPFEGELEVALLEDGEDAADYQGLDVAGKLVLTRGDVRRVQELAVGQHGAAGILYDGMRAVLPVRPEGDLADVRRYTSFWWQPGDVKCFGFVLTPRQGQMLRRVLKDIGSPVRVRARVLSRLYDGAHEVVSAAIPGETDDEILVVAHLCHPQPSANDNASGAAAALEAARTLQSLVDGGELRRPRRTIRFLWMEEMTGTVAYLSGHEADLGRLVAGLNLDMVGEDQGQTGSSWLIERPPEAAASFAPELLNWLRESMLSIKGMADVWPSRTGLGEYPLYRLAETQFSGGSDHYILSDPTVGAPAPTLIQWPDRFYHTSADTPDHTDPRSLARSGALAAAYAYWLAVAGADEAAELGYEMVARFKGDLVEAAQVALSGAREAGQTPDLAVAGLDRQLAYRVERHRAALSTLERLAPLGCLLTDLQAEVQRAAEHELAWAQGGIRLTGLAGSSGFAGRTGEKAAGGGLSELEGEAGELVPVRKMPGPVPLSDHLGRLAAEERTAWQELVRTREDQSADTLTTLALYWADGARSVLDITERVELETGTRDVELLLGYFRVLEKLGLVAWE